MKLLQLLEATATGAGRHVMDLTEGLLARGHEVHLLYSPLRCDQVFLDDLRRLRGLPNFHWLSLPMRRHPSRTDIAVAKLLRRYLRERGPFDLAHSHGTKAGFIMRASLIRYSVQRLHTPHGFVTMDPAFGSVARRLAGMLEAALSIGSSGVVVVSREEYAHAIELGIPPRKLCLIPNGVAPLKPGDGERSTHRRAWGLREGELCVGFVGRLATVKAPEVMLDSFASFRRRNPAPAKLVMVGDGPLAGQLRRQAANLRVEADVIWLGPRDARPLMCAFDVFCLTSNAEGHPLVVLEAMAQGLPIVATRVGGISETVETGVNGFIAHVRGVNEIAAALDALSSDAALRDRMRRASRTLVRNFSIDRMVDQTIAFYHRLLSGTRSESAAPNLKIAASR